MTAETKDTPARNCICGDDAVRGDYQGRLEGCEFYRCEVCGCTIIETIDDHGYFEDGTESMVYDAP